MIEELSGKLIHDSIKLGCFHDALDIRSCSPEKVYIEKDIRFVHTHLNPLQNKYKNAHF
jgi:hypothetical protein